MNDQLRGSAEQDEFWTTEEVARFLGISARTVYQWRFKKLAPLEPYVLQVGSRSFLRWSRSEVEALLRRPADGN